MDKKAFESKDGQKAEGKTTNVKLNKSGANQSESEPQSERKNYSTETETRKIKSVSMETGAIGDGGSDVKSSRMDRGDVIDFQIAVDNYRDKMNMFCYPVTLDDLRRREMEEVLKLAGLVRFTMYPGGTHDECVGVLDLHMCTVSNAILAKEKLKKIRVGKDRKQKLTMNCGEPGHSYVDILQKCHDKTFSLKFDVTTPCFAVKKTPIDTSSRDYCERVACIDKLPEAITEEMLVKYFPDVPRFLIPQDDKGNTFGHVYAEYDSFHNKQVSLKKHQMAKTSVHGRTAYVSYLRNSEGLRRTSSRPWPYGPQWSLGSPHVPPSGCEAHWSSHPGGSTKALPTRPPDWPLEPHRSWRPPPVGPTSLSKSPPRHYGDHHDHRRPSPGQHRSHSRDHHRRSRSGDHRRSRSPVRSLSPWRHSSSSHHALPRSQSPRHHKSRSPRRQRSRSPRHHMSRSSRHASFSRRSISPHSYRRHTPTPLPPSKRSLSPLSKSRYSPPYKSQQSLSACRSPSQLPLRARSPIQPSDYRRSQSPLPHSRRSSSPLTRRRSLSPPAHRRSPSPLTHRGSPSRYPERMTRLPSARSLSPSTDPQSWSKRSPSPPAYYRRSPPSRSASEYYGGQQKVTESSSSAACFSQMKEILKIFPQSGDSSFGDYKGVTNSSEVRPFFGEKRPEDIRPDSGQLSVGLQEPARYYTSESSNPPLANSGGSDGNRGEPHKYVIHDSAVNKEVLASTSTSAQLSSSANLAPPHGILINSKPEQQSPVVVELMSNYRSDFVPNSIPSFNHPTQVPPSNFNANLQRPLVENTHAGMTHSQHGPGPRGFGGGPSNVGQTGFPGQPTRFNAPDMLNPNNQPRVPLQQFAPSCGLPMSGNSGNRLPSSVAGMPSVGNFPNHNMSCNFGNVGQNRMTGPAPINDQGMPPQVHPMSVRGPGPRASNPNPMPSHTGPVGPNPNVTMSCQGPPGNFGGPRNPNSNQGFPNLNFGNNQMFTGNQGSLPCRPLQNPTTNFNVFAGNRPNVGHQNSLPATFGGFNQGVRPF